MESAHRGDLKLALMIAITQLLLALLLGILFLIFETMMLSAAAAGALIGLLASSAFALISLRPGRHRPASKILLDLYLGQVGKWIMVVMTIIVAIKFLPDIDQGINILVLLAAFLLSQSAYLLVPSVLKKRF